MNADLVGPAIVGGSIVLGSHLLGRAYVRAVHDLGKQSFTSDAERKPMTPIDHLEKFIMGSAYNEKTK